MVEEKKYSEIHEQFGLELAVKSVCFLIERKSNLSENSVMYIQLAKDYLQNATKSLDTIANHEKYESYHFTPYLKELIEETGGKKIEGLSKDDVLNVKSKLVLLTDNLDKLKKNPHAFYETKASREMLEFFKSFLPKFETKSYPIFSCGEYIPGDD